MGGIAPRYFAVLDSVVPNREANAAGLLKGDSIVGVNGESAVYWNEFTGALKENKNTALSVDYYRDGELVNTTLVPDSNGTVGLLSKSPSEFFKVTHKEFSLVESIPGGINLGLESLGDYVAQLKFLFTKKGAGSIGGFGAFGGLFSPTWDWHVFWVMTAFISIMLAFMNFLPIPALDGGHIMFLLYEIITGRKPNEKVMEFAQMAGIILLLSLLLYANGNDIYKAITGN
jgi:regulator of sigma E protease